jgi:pimeloyl-ACP methyl ester carboxylesterase
MTSIALAGAAQLFGGVVVAGVLPLSIALATGIGLLAGCSGSRSKGSPLASTATDADFAGLVDIGGHRKMYLEHRGTGSPTVVLVSGLDAAADLWNRDEQAAPKVFPQVAKFTEVCAYDRPGTPYGVGLPSRSDPVSQPTTTRDAITDLHLLLHAATVPGPYVLVGHSYGGLVTRLYASTYPEEVCGMVLVDVLSDGLQDGMTPAQWETWKKANARKETDIAEYPDLERIDFDVSIEQVRVAAPLRPMPFLVLSADVRYGPTLPSLIEAGELPADTPPDFGYVIDRSNQIAQANLAQLVPGAKHVTDTHSGHNMMIDQPQLVIDAIREVVEAVRNGNSRLSE